MIPLAGILLKLENGLRLEFVMDRCPVMAATPMPLKARTESAAAITSGARMGFFCMLMDGLLFSALCRTALLRQFGLVI
jgi:hypothetical protein